MTNPVDPAAYWKLLKAIFDDRPKRRKTEDRPPVPKPAPAPPAPLVYRPTLNRAEVRGRVLAMIRTADQAIDATTSQGKHPRR